MAGHSRHSRHRSRSTVVPTPRDLRLFAFLGTHGIATLEQVHQAFWPERQRQTCLDRLTQLMKARYLFSEITTVRGQDEQIFWIGRKAGMLFAEDERECFIRKAPAYAEIAHQLRANDILQRLDTRYGLLSFVGEHELKAGKIRTRAGAQIADLHVHLARPLAGHAVWMIEVDGAYYGRMLRTKMQSLASSGARVAWVCFTKARLARMTREAARYPSIYPMLLDQL